ncbi:TonB-dependent receptor [Oxalicibacterium flavum]|nr:TonB-dependent receptor [Oxalicibacterium flavum]
MKVLPTLQAMSRPSEPGSATRAVVYAALLGLSMGAVMLPHGAQAQSAAAEAAARQSYQVGAGTLGAVLSEFAMQAGVTIQIDSTLVEGRQSVGLKGSYTVEEGFARLLAGSGMDAVRRGGKVYVLQGVVPDAVLPAVTVREQLDATSALQQEGKAADGYRSKTVSSVGALGSMALVDVPFSVSVVPQELIQNIQAQSTDDIYRINPYTRTMTAQGTGWSPVVNMRGFTTSDTAEDGLRRPYNHAAVVEDKERVEVLNGLSGFLYGAAAPAGMINYVYKRPTVERLNRITVGNYGGSQYYVHGDFGGRFDEAGRIGYRLNVVRQNGETAIDDQKIDRNLVSAAFDWKVTDDLLLEMNAIYNNYKTQAPSAYWFYNAAIPRGPAPDASKNWSQPWIHDEFNNTKLSARLTYKLNDNVTLRGGYTQNSIDRPVQDHTMNSAFSTTQYRQLRQRAGASEDTFDAGQAMIDIGFNTGTVEHKVTAGYYMYSARSWSNPFAPHTGYVGPYPLTEPTHVPEPVFPANTVPMEYDGKASNDNILIGDMIRFNDQWSILAGVNRSTIKSQAEGYDKSKTSPSFSVMFKPVPNVTTYASYIEGLEMGGVADDTAVNRGTVMPPMVSKQKEVGIKAEVGGMLLTGALFEIEKSYEYINAGNVYTQDGRQNHKGLELTATGKATRNLTLIGGVTFLDPSIKGGSSEGLQPMNVAKTLAKLYAEYALPAVPGLTLTGGVFHTGKQWANAVNSSRLPAYTTADLGVRYATRAGGRPWTFSLYASNVTDKNYWLNSYYLGAPRSIAFSAQTEF